MHRFPAESAQGDSRSLNGRRVPQESALHAEVSLVVRASREKVYAAYTDFESMPKWSSQVTAVRVVERKEGTARIEIEGRSGGRPRLSVEKLALSPPERVETEGETRFTRTRRTVKFAAVPDGTEVTAAMDVDVKGWWTAFFNTRGKEEAESSAREALKSFATYVEGLT